jgi:O-antigen/teichoic acid export membrane protein
MKAPTDSRTRGSRPAGVREWASGYFGASARQGAWALVDQGMVSGARFATTIIVGRTCGAEELGLYALGFALFVLILVLQESLILTPYTVLGSREQPATRRELAGSVLVHHGVLVVLAMITFAVSATILAGIGRGQMAAIIWVLAATTPFLLHREFARRFSYAHLRVRTALALDTTVAAIQLGGLLVLAGTGDLSAPAAFGVTGLACAVGSLLWLVTNRRAFVVRWRRLRSHLAQNWSFGRWVFGTQQVTAFAGSSIYWLISALISTTATGLYTACSTVVTVAYPAILGLANVLEPRTARAFVSGGKPELMRVVRKVTFIVAAFLGVYWLAILLVGEQVVARLYAAPIFAGQGHMIIVLATAMVIRAVRVGWNHGLRATGNPRWNFFASLVELAVMLATIVPLAGSLGVLGAAYCILIGSIAGTVFRRWAFVRILGDGGGEDTCPVHYQDGALVEQDR